MHVGGPLERLLDSANDSFWCFFYFPGFLLADADIGIMLAMAKFLAATDSRFDLAGGNSMIYVVQAIRFFKTKYYIYIVWLN